MNKVVRKVIVWGLLVAIVLPNIVIGEPVFKLFGLTLAAVLMWWDVVASRAKSPNGEKQPVHKKPKSRHKRKLVIILAVLVAVPLLGLIGLYTGSQVLWSMTTEATNTTNLERGAIIALHNSERSKLGLAPLTENTELNNSACRKVNDMYDRKYYAHTTPEGLQPWDFMKLAGYDYKYAGENLATGIDTNEEVMSSWMQSPGHRENVVANFKDIGVCIKGTMVVTHFGVEE